jgi:regulator of protease activity HflC (stomatin/prohibitin superfamily)
MFYILALVLIVFFLAAAIRILKEYERGVIFRLGRAIKTKGSDFIILKPIIAGIGDVHKIAGFSWSGRDKG